MKIAFPTLRLGVFPKLPGERLEYKETEFLFKWAKRVGFEGVELEDETFGLTKMSDEQLVQFSELLNRYGLEAASIKVGGDLLREEAEYNERIMTKAIYVAKALKAKIVSISLGENLAKKGVDNATRLGGNFRYASSAWATEEDYINTAFALRRICKQCENSDVSLSLEIRTSSIADNSDSIIKLCNLVNHPKFGLNPDLANVIWAYNQPEESWLHCLEKIAPYTNYLHLKNIVPLKISELNRTIYKRGLLYDGTIDFRYVLQYMGSKNYDGYCVIEGPADGDKLYYFEEDYRYLSKIVLEIDALHKT